MQYKVLLDKKKCKKGKFKFAISTVFAYKDSEGTVNIKHDLTLCLANSYDEAIIKTIELFIKDLNPEFELLGDPLVLKMKKRGKGRK